MFKDKEEFDRAAKKLKKRNDLIQAKDRRKDRLVWFLETALWIPLLLILVLLAMPW